MAMNKEYSDGRVLVKNDPLEGRVKKLEEQNKKLVELLLIAHDMGNCWKALCNIQDLADSLEMDRKDLEKYRI